MVRLHVNYYLQPFLKTKISPSLLILFFVLAKFKSSPNSTLSNIMTRMSSSTPSLPEASNDSSSNNVSVSSTDQTASADNLASKVWY